MQTLPLLTPTDFSNNSKKRSRASVGDDFDSHCLKKRLLSTIPVVRPPPLSADDDDSPRPNDSIREIVTLSPLTIEELSTHNRPSESKYFTPGFVLSGTNNYEPSHPSAGQLILYEKNPILASIEKELKHQQIDDDNSMTSKEDDEEYDPMDLD